MKPRKALTIFPTMLHLDDFVQILPDLLQCALFAAEILSLVDAEHSYAIDELDNILVNVNRLNNEQGTECDEITAAVVSYDLTEQSSGEETHNGQVFSLIDLVASEIRLCSKLFLHSIENCNRSGIEWNCYAAANHGKHAKTFKLSLTLNAHSSYNIRVQ